MDMGKIKNAVSTTVDALDAPDEVHRTALDAMLDVYEDYFGAESWQSKYVIGGVRWLTKTPDDIGGDED